MAYSVISFDLDDTLWPFLPTIRRAEAAMYDCLRQHCPDLCDRWNLEALRAHRQDFVRRRPDLSHDMTALRREALRELLEGGPDHLPALALEAFMRERSIVEPYPDVEPVLARLHQHYTLVALTNGNADVFLTPLAKYFHHHLCSGEVGCSKPDRRMFQAILERTGAEREAVLHVGDDVECDVIGGMDFGLDAIWLNREGVCWPYPERPPTGEIHTLYDLARFIPFGTDPARVASDPPAPFPPKTTP